MLILQRRPSEAVFIGDDIIVTVLDIDRGQVRLGFTVPRDVPVDRAEIRRAKLTGKPVSECRRDGRAD